MFRKISTEIKDCPICENERKVIRGTRKETVKINNQNIEVPVESYYCSEGNHYFTDLEQDEKRIQHAYRKYREQNELLQPEEITAIRDKYGLSQTDFSLLLGFGQITVHRYETGALQDQAHNIILEFIKQPMNFYILYKKNIKLLPTKVAERIKGKLTGQHFEDYANLQRLRTSDWLFINKRRSRSPLYKSSPSCKSISNRQLQGEYIDIEVANNEIFGKEPIYATK
jgi:putative zinc finger/helix-turn-helix YgiT family protein